MSDQPDPPDEEPEAEPDEDAEPDADAQDPAREAQNVRSTGATTTGNPITPSGPPPVP